MIYTKGKLSATVLHITVLLINETNVALLHSIERSKRQRAREKNTIYNSNNIGCIISLHINNYTSQSNHLINEIHF